MHTILCLIVKYYSWQEITNKNKNTANLKVQTPITKNKYINITNNKIVFFFYKKSKVFFNLVFPLLANSKVNCFGCCFGFGKLDYGVMAEKTSNVFEVQ